MSTVQQEQESIALADQTIVMLYCGWSDVSDVPQSVACPQPPVSTITTLLISSCLYCI